MEMKKIKKYPLLLSMIVSAVIIVVSLFILGFFGIKLGTSLAGGSQFEITLTADSVDTVSYVKTIKKVVKENGQSVDSAFVEDKFMAGDTEQSFSRSCLVVTLSNADIPEDVKTKIIDDLSQRLGIDKSNISPILTVTSSIEAKSVLFIGIAIAIVAIALFAFAWVRYDLFAGLTFIITFLHNIILYLAVIILTRVELGLMSLSIALILTLVMSILLINIFEKYREEVSLQFSEKQTITQRMISCEVQAVKPFVFVAVAVLVFALILLFVPVTSIRLTSVNILISLIITAYTSLIIGPAVYANLLDVREIRQKAVLSRNSEINKVIKEKVKKNSKKKLSETKVENKTDLAKPKKTSTEKKTAKTKKK